MIGPTKYLPKESSNRQPQGVDGTNPVYGSKIHRNRLQSRIYCRVKQNLLNHLRLQTAESSDVEVLPVSIKFGYGTADFIRPDILVARRCRFGYSGELQFLDIPLIAIELGSVRSARDSCGRRRAYQRSGVAEYWWVNLTSNTIERWTPANQRQILTKTLSWDPPDNNSCTIVLKDLFEA